MLKILILTSKDHPYANLILRIVLTDGITASDHVTVLEQDSLMPGKSRLKGLAKYISTSGPYYVAAQIVKQYLFILCRFICQKRMMTASHFFPYYVNEHPHFRRQTLNRLNSEEAVRFIRDMAPDIILSVLSKEIIHREIIEIPPLGTFNLHPSLLPHDRGVSPTFWALANGRRETGVSLHRVDTGIDTGQIVSSVKTPLDSFRTEHSLYIESAQKGARLVVDLLHRIRQGGKAMGQVNQSEAGNYNSLPTKQAVKDFRKRGLSFFRIHEFISELRSDKKTA